MGKDKVEEDTKTKEDLNIEEPWRLLLHNDDVHTFEYVTYMIQKIPPRVEREGVPADDDDALRRRVHRDADRKTFGAEVLRPAPERRAHGVYFSGLELQEQP